MSKPAKIFIIAVAAVVGSLSILLALVSRLSVPAAPARQEAKVDLVKLEQDYKERAKAIVAELSRLIESEPAATIEDINKDKKALLALTVPPQFKDLHLSLVMAADKIINFLSGNDQKGKLAGAEILKQAKADYDWLN